NMKRKIIIANWKMNLGFKESKTLSEKILKKLKTRPNFFLRNLKIKKLDIILCPSFTNLSEVSRILKSKSGIFLGAQDCFWEDHGEFTGEISPVWLKNLGCRYVILGHSERRKNLKETNNMVHQKVKAALKAELIPIICIGETLEERRRGIKDYVILDQLSSALTGIDLDLKQKIIIAYEPVWVIGSGRAITPNEAEYMNKIILQRMIDFYPLERVKKNISIIYGGSVSADNVKSFVDLETTDGVLVGGSSLKAAEFVKICQAII
ncbi:triose-phosphate isomerase, partial [Patescibacteria group bacterium]|nr:triose-phosphate isomerase [Patescibacteria group bacterium]